MHSFAGTDTYQDNAYGVDQDWILLHEAILSYQVNPRLNFRYFANWNTELDYLDGEHRIEVNYQL